MPGSPVVRADAVRGPSCPAGMVYQHEMGVAGLAAGAAGSCAPALGVDKPRELMQASAQLAAAHEGLVPVRPGAYAAAVAQRATLASTSTALASSATWTRLGKGPLVADAAGFPSTNTLGLANLAGRIQSFAYDTSRPGHWFAAFANGGVFTTSNAGASWRSIGDHLPTQITGAVAYTPATHAILVGTGDPAFGGTSFSGLGVFRSTDDGASWHRSTGVPDGTLTFRIALDPSRPSTVYAATGKGLYRSTDGGSSFRNVVLPTGCTDTHKSICFFANIVTDVVVRPSNRDGSGGGRVLAAVGWRAGQKLNAAMLPQSPHNGLYLSDTGAPGSFRFLSNPPGFTPDSYVGRTALGVARGARQNHDYVYALVQDAAKFNGGATSLDAPEPRAKLIPNNTVLNGVYGSKDFGRTWIKMADADQLKIGTGTALAGPFAATYAPGIQSWYNEWIDPDPTVQDEAGVPGRLGFGLEEVWNGSGALPSIPNGSRFTVTGRYFSGQTCLFLTTGLPYCPTASNPTTPQGLTTHPDQHAGTWIPDGKGGVTLLVGNDGGAYAQHVAAGQALDNDHWGRGIQNGLDTLLPYDAQLAKDGTGVAGLQDNGEMLITPQGKQIETYGGDGFFTAIDPNNSKVQYEEYVGGVMSVSTDGGHNWASIDPALTTPLFATPFVMDRSNAKHLVIGGRDVQETLAGPDTDKPLYTDPVSGTAVPDPSAPSWTKVYDLGTRKHPGDASASADKAGGDPNNAVSAVDTRGNNTYVGFCGFCDIVTGGLPFGSGIATNVGGSKPGKAGTSDGWHIATAAGLPQRYVTSVVMDPANPRTVYATLAGYSRRWIPPGSLGDSVSKIGTGHVFKSTDAGASFKDISGDLPDIGADDTLIVDGHLLVANDLGVFLADGTSGGHYSLLGRNLPAAPVFQLNASPRNRHEVVAASYGRGVLTLVLPSAAAGTASLVPSGALRPASGDLPRTGGSSQLPWLALAPLLAGLLLLRQRRT
ncbi:MAG: hypothetical protein NVS3B26_09480 [Mycobacteriales bacterium]